MAEFSHHAPSALSAGEQCKTGTADASIQVAEISENVYLISGGSQINQNSYPHQEIGEFYANYCLLSGMIL